jgi:uncharacterized membrane protein
MRGILRFVRTTFVGGILFLLPIIVVVVIVDKALVLTNKAVAPVATHLPVSSSIGLATPKLLAIALLILFCFVTGNFARTAIARKMVNSLETTVLSNVPGYEFIKSMSQSVLGADSQLAHSVVLARIEDAWQIAFLVERLEGGYVAVFVAGAPSPQSGAVYFMTEDRIRLVDIPISAVLKCLKRYGLGSNTLLSSHLNRQAAVALKNQQANESGGSKQS